MAATKARAKSIGPRRLKKEKKVTPAGVDLKQYRLRYGTPNEMCDPIPIATEAKVRSDIVKHLRTEIEPWCERYNQAGKQVIEQIILDLQAESIHLGTVDDDRRKFPGTKFNTGTRISGCYDEHYGMTVAYEFWSEWT
jgi:hypothetical protein